jgi:hypothetical protein
MSIEFVDGAVVGRLFEFGFIDVGQMDNRVKPYVAIQLENSEAVQKFSLTSLSAGPCLQFGVTDCEFRGSKSIWTWKFIGDISI